MNGKNFLYVVLSNHGWEAGNQPFRSNPSTWQEPAWLQFYAIVAKILPWLSFLAAVVAPIQVAKLLKNIHEEKPVLWQTVTLIICLVIWQLQFYFFA